MNKREIKKVNEKYRGIAIGQVCHLNAVLSNPKDISAEKLVALVTALDDITKKFDEY